MKFRKKKHEAGVYFCLADAHGIESFMEYEKYEKTNFPFTVRAEVNRRRHAITFVIDLNQTEVDKIYECLENSYFIEVRHRIIHISTWSCTDLKNTFISCLCRFSKLEHMIRNPGIKTN